MIRFLADENIPIKAVEALKAERHRHNPDLRDFAKLK